MGAIAQLQAAGFSPSEVDGFVAQKRAALLGGGFTEGDVQSYLGSAAKLADGPIEAIQAGYQGSATGLMLRGRLPDVVLDHTHATWYEKALASAGQLVSEIPEMVVGGIAGGAAGTAVGGAVGSAVPVLGTATGGVVGGLVGSGAGAFAVPAAIREAYTQALTRGEVTSSADFLTRASIVMKTTAKEGLVGGLTMGAGGLAARTAGKIIAPAIGESLTVPAATRAISTAGTAAELGTMVVAPAALEGKMPEPEDFLNAAIVLGGLKGATHVAGGLRNIWAKAGIQPEQVVADAKSHPAIVLALKPVEKPITTEPMVTVYHGSPHEFETFDASKIGSGEGAQVYGHGLYFADNPSVASGYKRSTSYADVVRRLKAELPDDATPEELTDSARAGAFSEKANRLISALAGADWLGFDYPSQAISQAFKSLENFDPESPGTKAVADAVSAYGNTYKVQISQRVVDSMLDWDRPLNQQSPYVKDALKRSGLYRDIDNITRTVAEEAKQIGGISKEFADELSKLGITGIRYLDAKSRGKGDGTRNYVLFDAKDARVIERNGEQIPAAYKPLADAETARAIVPGEKATEVAASPFAEELPQAKGEPAKPAHVNYNYINTAEDTKLALARLSQVYEAEINAQRRGTVSWEETSQEAAQLLADTLGQRDTKLLMPREPGTPAGAAEILARKQLAVGAAEAMMAARDELLAKGDAATPADHIAFLQAIERVAMIQQEFLGARAEAGRALNILKSTSVEAERAKQIQEVIDRYGKNPVELATMLKQIDSPAGALKFAKDAVKATTWEKIVEAWKASILSGLITHMANLMGNTTFLAVRAPVDAVAATLGMLHGGERVSAMEPFARMFGSLQGSLDGLKIGAAILRHGEETGKAEQFRKAIEGTKGEIIRLPFRALAAEDAVFKTMNERAELYTIATRQATSEGINPLTREFRERIVELVQNPTDAMTKASEAAGLRFTFNTPLGEKGQAIQNVVRKLHLEWAVPFIRTPGNIAKELARMTPFAPLVSEWRQALSEKGVARDKAMAELVVGTGVMAGVISLVFNETISGQGSADPNKRRVMAAGGWQPYSVKIGDTYYSYQRLQPVGTLMGLAADLAEVWDRLDTDESDKIPKMLAVAFANAVTNQTFLQGITNIVNAASDPTRFGPRFAQQYAASLVPAAIGQTTQMNDPIQREVNSMLDAVKSRVPGARQTLLPKRDIFGEPVQTKERLGAVSPITETTESTDKVRTEAVRLGISVADVPKKVHIGRGTGKAGEVEMTPEQKDTFSAERGRVAHEVLTSIVNSPSWDDMPLLAKQRIYKRVFMIANRQGAVAALPPEERGPLLRQIADSIEFDTGQR